MQPLLSLILISNFVPQSLSLTVKVATALTGTLLLSTYKELMRLSLVHLPTPLTAHIRSLVWLLVVPDATTTSALALPHPGSFNQMLPLVFSSLI